MNSFQHILRSFKGQLPVQLASLAVLVGTFTITALALTLHQNLHSLLTKWGSEVQVSVYLQDSATETQKEKVKEFLKQNELFKSVEYLSKEKAVEFFASKMGQLSPALLTDNSFANPLPASFEVEIEGGVKSASIYSDLVGLTKIISQLPGVEEVSYGQGWVENYAAAIQVFSTVSLTLICVLLAGGFFVVGNSIRSSVSQRRDEIEILELCGATRWTIQKPYILEGLFMGFIAALISIAISYLLFSWGRLVWVQQLQFWSENISFRFMSLTTSLFLVLLSTAVGAIGSYMCVRRINTGWAAAQND